MRPLAVHAEHDDFAVARAELQQRRFDSPSRSRFRAAWEALGVESRDRDSHSRVSARSAMRCSRPTLRLIAPCSRTSLRIAFSTLTASQLLNERSVRCYTPPSGTRDTVFVAFRMFPEHVKNMADFAGYATTTGL